MTELDAPDLHPVSGSATLPSITRAEGASMTEPEKTEDEELAERIARREKIEAENGNPTPLLGALFAELLR